MLGKRYLQSFTTPLFWTVLRRTKQNLRAEWQASRRHRKSARIAGKYLNGTPLRLNLGCGPNRKNGWVNIDLFDPAADLQLDVRNPWPFPDRSAAHVYSEHTFEHLEPEDEVPHFLAEALRVLQLGGIFDVGVPDTEWPLKAYGNDADPYWKLVSKMGWHPGCVTQLDHINYHFRQGHEHKYAWDEPTLARSLELAGFVNIRRRNPDPSIDHETRLVGTLYMIGSKPR
jgi:predicted SAM-dependent methyltransferase